MARVEVVTGRERRRRWSDAEKLGVLAEADASGLSLAEVARRHDLYPQQLYAWRRLLRERLDQRVEDDGRAYSFLPVELASTESGAGPVKTPTPAPASAPRRAGRTIAVRLANGRVLTAPEAIEADRLQRLIRAVETA